MRDSHSMITGTLSQGNTNLPELHIFILFYFYYQYFHLETPYHEMPLYKNTNMSETAKRKYADHLYSFATILDKIWWRKRKIVIFLSLIVERSRCGRKQTLTHCKIRNDLQLNIIICWNSDQNEKFVDCSLQRSQFDGQIHKQNTREKYFGVSLLG